MVFGTVGTTVSAQYGGSVTHTNPVTPGPGNYSGAFYVSLEQAGTGVDEGVRYSLVKVDKDAIASSEGITSFDQYETLGTYDVLSDTLYNDMVNGTYLKAYTKDGVIYFTNMSYNNVGPNGTSWVQRQNALDYEVGFKQYGRNYLTSADMFSFRRDNLGAGNSRDIGTVDTFFELAANVYSVYYTDATEYSEHIANLNNSKSAFISSFVESPGNVENALLNMTINGSAEVVSGEDGRYVGENNELLNALVMVLSATPYLDGEGALSATYRDYLLTAEDFIEEGSDYCYRILAEPTTLEFTTASGYNEAFLVTLRDIFALNEIYTLSPFDGYYSYDTNNIVGSQNAPLLGYMVYAIAQSADEFVDYDKTTYTNTLNADQSNVDEALGKAIEQWKIDNPNATPAFTAFTDDYYVASGSGQTGKIERAILEGYVEGSSVVKPYAAYSLGILAPYNYVPPTEEKGIVTIIKAEAGTGKKLEGATFVIEDENDSTWGPITRTTDSNGEIELNIEYDNLVVGHTYLVTESDPPTGYEKIDTPQEFTIVEDSDGNLSADPSTLTFEDPAAEGEAHLLIDYNMNGFSATVGTSGG
ncbi:MAG: prealbumin-like fold domain-containing protein [Clostridia bacterium]|nr:prealbumin-like fold domain-containing protein [Clostridia bacterium]